MASLNLVMRSDLLPSLPDEVHPTTDLKETADSLLQLASAVNSSHKEQDEYRRGAHYLQNGGKSWYPKLNSEALNAFTAHLKSKP